VSEPAQTNLVAAAVARLTGRLALMEGTEAIELVAGFIDAQGAVRFSCLLEETPIPVSDGPARDAAQIERSLLVGLADIEGRLEDAFTHAFRPRYRLPGAARAWSTLGQFGLLETEDLDSTALHKASRLLWGPFGEFLETQLKRLRFALRDLRAEVGADLRSLGPAAAELVHLDAALVVATAGALDGLHRRIGPALEGRFEAGLREALGAKAQRRDLTTFTVGFGPEGWVGEIVEDAAVLYRALLQREGQRLCELVKSASALAVDP